MKTKSKKFHVGDILSITNKRLVSPTQMDGVTAIMEYMTDSEGQIYSIGLTFAAKQCKPYLDIIYPNLKKVDYDKLDKMRINSNFDKISRDEQMKVIIQWLDEEAVPIYGRWLEVYPIVPLPTIEEYQTWRTINEN